MVLYVGGQPVFDKCMEGICLAERPDQYRISWVQSFNLDSVLSKQGKGIRDALAGFDLLQLFRQPKYLLGNLTTSYAANFIQTLSNLTGIVTEASDGWLLGTGSWNDPCVDRQGTINTIIVFVVFFLLMCVVVFDYFLQRRTSGGGHWLQQLNAVNLRNGMSAMEWLD
jgi:hypothetical protein